MNEQRQSRPAPKKLEEIPEHVRKWLNSIDERDIERFRKWNDFIVWFEASGRYTRTAVIFMMSALGLYTAIVTVLARWTGRG